MCSWTVNARGKTRVDIFLSVHFSQIIQNKLYWNAYANMYIASAEPILAVGSSGVDSTWNPNDRVFKLAKTWIIYCIPSGKNRKYLYTLTAEKISNYSITSHLDYCSNFFYVAEGHIIMISQLQFCQNHATRLIRRKITTVMKGRHWLPVGQNIEYKVLLLTW